MNKEDSLPSWWSDKITLSQSYLSKATDYLTNPVESIKVDIGSGNVSAVQKGDDRRKKIAKSGGDYDVLDEASLTIPQYKTSIKKLSHSQQDKLFDLLHKLKLMKLIDFINYRDGSLHIAKSSITPKIKKDIEKKFKISLKESVNENLRPSDKKILMVIATELVKTQMKGKNKNKIRKELPNILSTMGTNRFNKNKMISLGKGFGKLSDSDKKVFINTLMYNVGLAKSINEKKKMFPPDKMTPKQAKEYKKFIDYAKMGIEYKIDMSLFESINEDGHTDVPSAVRKLKTSIEDALQIIGYLKKVNDAEPLPSWWTDKVTLSSNYLNTARNYILNPHESVFAVRQDKIKNGERFPKEPNFDYDPEKGKSRIRKVNEMTTSQARDTLNHLGGKRFIVMTGAKPLTIDKKRKELLFKIGRNAKGINLVTIRLTSLDLYDMEFAQVRMGNKKVKAVEKRVYGDQLQKFFKKHTGMNTYL